MQDEDQGDETGTENTKCEEVEDKTAFTNESDTDKLQKTAENCTVLTCERSAECEKKSFPIDLRAEEEKMLGAEIIFENSNLG